MWFCFVSLLQIIKYLFDLRWEPRLGAFVDLVVLDDAANDGVALFKTVEALRGTFFFSTSVEHENEGRWGRGSWPWYKAVAERFVSPHL